MRIAVIGAGGVGGYLAAKLAAEGEDVIALARGAHLAAIRAGGLTLRAREGESVSPLKATDDVAEIGPVDLAIVAVKAQDLDALDLGPILGPDTGLLPFLNGVEAPERLDARYGAGRSMSGVARISATIVAPGVVGLHAPFARFEIGEVDGARTGRLERICRLFESSGVEASVPENPLRALWLKFLMLAPFSSVTAAARCDAATLRGQPLLLGLYRTLAAEAAAVGEAAGAGVSAADVETAMKTLAGLPGSMRASMAHDLAVGKPLEVDWLAGAVSRLGDRHGVPTPASDTVWAVLRPFVGGPPAA